MVEFGLSSGADFDETLCTFQQICYTQGVSFGVFLQIFFHPNNAIVMSLVGFISHCN